MGNGVGKLKFCFAGDAGDISGRRHDIAVYISDHLDEGFGHSFCYFGPDPNDSASAVQTTTSSFKTISGASLSANTCTQLSTLIISKASLDKASSFQSSDSFTAIPLQPIPRNSIPSVRSGPIPRTAGSMSGPVERWFLSGPIERSLISGPLENQYDHIQRYKPSSKKWSLIKRLKQMIANSITLPAGQPKGWDWATGLEKNNENVTVSSQTSLADESDESFESSSVQWAQGKAGEDRVHIVVSEEDGWVFVGIYDGFNGPDATDFLLSNLYSNVLKELRGLLWNDASETAKNSAAMEMDKEAQDDEFDQSVVADHVFDNGSQWLGQENHPCRKKRRKSMNSHWRWKREWERERSELDRILKEKSRYSGCTNRHSDVLRALSEALRKTEESYLEIADLMLMENPVLSLMGSCVLVMLMKGEDVYLMNVGDSRAVLAQNPEPDIGIGKAGRPDLERIKEETTNDLEAFDGDEFSPLTTLDALQLTVDHGTSMEEEVRRIKKEHQDDATAIANDRVKGSLKVTRAFGAGFLKKPKWNDALLEIFRIDYVGNSPYINCIPTLHHHRLGPRDRFLILSSDGLYQYFTNEEAVSEVEMFLSSRPEGDPAQHLVELVLSRAAKKAGMDFHELLDIPQGDRRRYHDDVSIIIISFEGRMWRSSL